MEPMMTDGLRNGHFGSRKLIAKACSAASKGRELQFQDGLTSTAKEDSNGGDED